MEEQLLFVVDLAVQISGRGCVLTPGTPTDPGSPDVRIGRQIRLVTPEGQSIQTHVAGIEMLNHGSRHPEKVTSPILLPQGITKEMVPMGTKVFLLLSGGAGA